MLSGRLLDTVIGIAVGLLVNLLVWPPLHDRAAARQIDRIDDGLGELLTAMADRLGDGGGTVEVDEWVDRTREVDHDIDSAWAAVRQARESGRLNLRRQAAPRVRATGDFADLLARLEQATAETRSMAQTVGRAGAQVETWDPRFRETWITLLAGAGAAVSTADAAAVARLREDIDAAVGSLSERSGALRPVHGALLVNLLNIADAMEAVAAAQPVQAAAAPHPRGAPAKPRV